ncbi:MAG: FAD-dependent monooxygenase [Planctomycetes bacterium]|nr:FAD-dependent monooxygenase [Planctomycetota bacterium]
MDAEFLIVGGGLGGGVLAGLLGRAGRRVLVLERNPGKTPIVRPEVLWPSTVEILASLLSPEALGEAMVPVKAIRATRGGELLVEIAPQTIAASGVQPWSTDPGATRSKLLELSAFEVRHGVEALSVLKAGERVVGVRARETAGGREFDLRARWTVGDDGAPSKVREACSIGLATRLFPIEFLCFGFDWPASLPPNCPHIFLNPEAGRSPLVGAGALPFPAGKGAGLVVALGSRLKEGPGLETEGSSFFRSDPRLLEIVRGRLFPRDFVHVKRPWGHAVRYGAEGAVLMGDAIHPVSPAGGQGANMSVHDARALAELFLSDHPRPVEEYERLRRPANERSISITRRASDAVEGKGVARVARRFARWLPKLANLPLVQQQVLKEISRAFVGDARGS